MIIGQRVLAFVAATIIIAATPAGAAADKDLRAVRGTSGYRATPSAPFQRVFGHITLTDDYIAVTQAASNALVVLPDSSEVALGENTSVQVGAFNATTAPTPTTIALQNGAVRFNVRHPAGGRANFRFSTMTSQIAVRGTIGLLGSGPNGDVLSCLQCDSGDVVVTVGTQTYTLLTGQTLFVSLAGVVTTAATAAAASAAFSGTGLTTDVAAQSAFTGSIGATSAAAAVVPAAALPVAGAVFAAGAAATIISTNGTHHPQTIAIPQATPTPSVGTGNATLTGATRKH